VPWNQSRFTEAILTTPTSRLETNASQIININMITAISEIRDPMEDIRFQDAKASG